MLKCRLYGENNSQTVILIHGGPAAFGNMKIIAENIQDDFRVVEPKQRTESSNEITVKHHIEDLKEIVERFTNDNNKPSLLGHSWGAMLALCYAAEYSDTISSVVIVGCGTFDEMSRSKMKSIISERLTKEIRDELEKIDNSNLSIDEKLSKKGKVINKIYNYDNFEDNSVIECSAKAHEKSWNDMMKLQKEGVYPKTFDNITIPVLMLHGKYDPHPGNLIYNNLKKYIPKLEYISYEKCGHSPWLEKSFYREFYYNLKKIWDYRK